MKKDLFKGVEYDLIEPKEGDIVRVNIHKCPAYSHRDHILVIYPSEGDIEEDNRQFIFHCQRYVGYIGRMDCGKVYVYKSEAPTFVKPTIQDMLDFSQKLREDGVIYDKKRKRIINIEKNESN